MNANYERASDAQVEINQKQATVHQAKDKTREDQTNQYLGLSIILFLPLGIYIAAFFFGDFHFSGFGHLLPMIIFGWPASYFFRKYRMLSSGLEGEKEAIEFISMLPEGYQVISNIKVNYDNYYNELDLVIVGQNGVFVIEVKNHNGQIEGSVDEKQWTQYKIGRKGTPYFKDIRNPIKQVKGQVMTLSRNFKDLKWNVWIQGIVLFTNPKVDLRVYGDSDIPVLETADIIEYITSYKAKITLKDQEINQIKTWMLEHQ